MLQWSFARKAGQMVGVAVISSASKLHWRAPADRYQIVQGHARVDVAGGRSFVARAPATHTVRALEPHTIVPLSPFVVLACRMPAEEGTGSGTPRSQPTSRL